MILKNFYDLEFKLHPNYPDSPYHVRATLDFPNGYTISVTTCQRIFEVFLPPNTGICHPPNADNIMSYCNPEKVTELMEAIQKLPKEEK